MLTAPIWWERLRHALEEFPTLRLGGSQRLISPFDLISKNQLNDHHLEPRGPDTLVLATIVTKATLGAREWL